MATGRVTDRSIDSTPSASVANVLSTNLPGTRVSGNEGGSINDTFSPANVSLQSAGDQPIPTEDKASLQGDGRGDSRQGQGHIIVNPEIGSASLFNSSRISAVAEGSNDFGRPAIESTTETGPGSYQRTVQTRRLSTRRTRPEREIVLPRWQPDAEALYCPVCRTQFSFFVRKHHCRKCGRVVCNSCSPHRITIPYQFIVHPPDSVPGGRNSHLIGEETDHPERDGGLKVRLCNPCVPDPNTLPPQQQPATQHWQGRSPPTYYLGTGNQSISTGEESMGRLERQANPNIADREAALTRSRGMTTGSNVSVDQSRYSYPLSASSYEDRRHTNRTNRSTPSLQSAVPTRSHSTRHQSLSTVAAQSSMPSQPHYRSLLDPALPPSTERPLPPVPRIPEEDECPVCHRELPSRSLPDFETARALHISQCIDNQIAAHSRPGAYTSNSSPTPSNAATAVTPLQLPPAAAPMAVPGPVNSEPTFPNTPEGRTAAREYRHAAVVLAATSSPSPSSASLRRTGMFPYTATEKDCVEEAECTICLEEFEVGVAMARLECLCRFHRTCIQQWFVMHPGRCPVHQHDGYGF